ncbi:hypothetical protein AB3480_35220 [Rhizobium mongolense]|uniref:hypothetical protein n=1 Tax=Rhizobium mongolense TaxID=57676 RepID=UPI0034A1B6A8
MAFWKGRGAAKENIRLFEAAKTWRRCADEIDRTTGEVEERGQISKPLHEGELLRHAEDVVERCLASIASHRIEAGLPVCLGNRRFQQYDGVFRQTSAGLGHQAIEIALSLRTNQTFQFSQ